MNERLRASIEDREKAEAQLAESRANLAAIRRDRSYSAAARAFTPPIPAVSPEPHGVGAHFYSLICGIFCMIAILVPVVLIAMAPNNVAIYVVSLFSLALAYGLYRLAKA